MKKLWDFQDYAQNHRCVAWNKRTCTYGYVQNWNISNGHTSKYVEKARNYNYNYIEVIVWLEINYYRLFDSIPF